MTPQHWLWLGFGVFVLAMLALDLGVFHRRSHTVGMKEALAWSGAWIALAGVMKLFVHLHYGLAAVLVFVGVKMLLSGLYRIPTLTSLLVIVGLLTAAVLASIWLPHPAPAQPPMPTPSDAQKVGDH